LKRAAGEDSCSSFRFLVELGEVGMLRRVLVDSPRIRFCGSLVAMVKELQLQDGGGGFQQWFGLTICDGY
jgi:hypothetical protein